MRIQYDKEFYSKEALLKAAYHFTDRAYVYLGVEDGSFFVDFTAKGGTQFDKETYTVSGVNYKTTWQNGACVSITKA